MTRKNRAALCAIACSGVWACSGTTAGRTGTADRGSTGGASSGAGMPGSGGAATMGNGGSAEQGGDGAGGYDEHFCNAQSHQPEAVPVDMLLLVDRSGSMNAAFPGTSGTWWTAVEGALSAFVAEPRANGVAVGIQYFPEDGAAHSCVSLSPLGDCCEPTVYEKPDTELALLPANTAALAASIRAQEPRGSRPTSSALEGAIAHMKGWAPDHLGRAPIVVLLTNGAPDECGNPLGQGADLPDIAALAKNASEIEPRVRTFVVALDGAETRIGLEQVAVAGGTPQVLSVNANDIGVALTNAMFSILTTPVDCAIDTPRSSTSAFDPELVDVEYTPNTTGVAEHIKKLNDPSECGAADGQGWYYASPTQPTKIGLCPVTCSSLGSGIVQAWDGCHTGSVPL